MTHLEVENLVSEYVEGQLGAARRLEVEVHLESCPACAEVVAQVRQAVDSCRSAADLEPPLWLVSKILLATIGERRPTLTERLSTLIRPVLQPRIAYTVAMAVFSFSVIINAAGISLRHFTLADLNPRTWVYRADRTGHLLYARAEKFYYDLRVVYEIESRFRQLRQQPSQGSSDQPGEDTKPQNSPGGSTDRRPPDGAQLAWINDGTNIAVELMDPLSGRAPRKRGIPR